jgi:hypothetical protein
MSLSVLRRSYTPEKLALPYRLLDELSLEASGARPGPITDAEKMNFRDRLARAIIMTVSSGEHDTERILQTVRPIVLARSRHQNVSTAPIRHCEAV